MDVPLKDESVQLTPPKEEVSKFFGPYEVNSILFKRTSGDDSSSEINISVRYFFKSQSGKSKADLYGWNPFFSYTAKSDFYWIPPLKDTRPSAPVISRYQNPAIHVQYGLTDGKFSRIGDWADVGLEHISNGQALTAKDNIALIQNAYQTNNNTVMDSISRVGAIAALTLEGHKLIGTNSDLTVKWYVYRYGQEADVYWGRFADRSVNFNDFQRVKIQWRTRYYGFNFTELPWQIGAELNIGSLGFSEDSWNFMLNTPVRWWGYELPFAITMHRGPMNNLSDYTRSQNNVAFGFSFAY